MIMWNAGQYVLYLLELSAMGTRKHQIRSIKPLQGMKSPKLRNSHYKQKSFRNGRIGHEASSDHGGTQRRARRNHFHVKSTFKSSKSNLSPIIPTSGRYLEEVQHRTRSDHQSTTADNGVLHRTTLCNGSSGAGTGTGRSRVRAAGSTGRSSTGGRCDSGSTSGLQRRGCGSGGRVESALLFDAEWLRSGVYVRTVQDVGEFDHIVVSGSLVTVYHRAGQRKFQVK